MNANDQPKREQDIFDHALDLGSAEDRRLYVQEACAGDAVLLVRVQALLRAHERTGSFLPEEPAATIRISEPDIAAITEKPGGRIGRYKLLEKIGEGGCGTVYMAEQEEPIRRRVALKVIKLGMDTRSVIARFEAERQALALMDHPNIAKVFDAGATEAGRPYFVMELVRGIRITDYCDQHRLATRARLDLFIAVCHAVQHAHQKGIIHRDLKPSNILVSSADGVPVPKVIDFGIAKATSQQPLTDKTLFTAFAQFVGTPAYMSPEQAELSAMDIDTRSDIYSLGVLLYELLTSRTPFDAEILLQAGLDEMRRIIRETEPLKPSTRLTERIADTRSLPSSSSPQPDFRASRRLLQEVKGDLDWIVMKCLEKDRKRRYETANALVQDLQHHLNHEPVTAAAPSAVYRFRKFVFRHKAGLATAVALVLLLVAGAVVSTWQAVRATRAEGEARTEAARSEQVGEFLRGMLTGVTPIAAKGRDTKLLQEILDKAAERVNKEPKGSPEVEEQLRKVIGWTYLQIGEYAKAEAMLREALALSTRLCGNEAPEVARVLDLLAGVLWKQGKLNDAEAMFRKALAMQARFHGPDNKESALSLHNLAAVLLEQGQLAKAEVAFRDALTLQQRLLGPEDPEVAGSLGGLAAVCLQQGKLPEAEQLFRKALAIARQQLGEEHPSTLGLLNNLAGTLQQAERLAEAEAMHQEALILQMKLLGPEHEQVVATLGNLGVLLAQQRKFPEAEARLREVLILRQKAFGPEHPEVASTLNNLAKVLQDQGRLGEAEALYRDAIAMFRKLLGKETPRAACAWNGLAELLAGQGKLAEAEAAYRQSVELHKQLGGPEHPHAYGAMDSLAELLWRQGKRKEGEALFRECLAMRKKGFGNESADVAGSLYNLALLLGDTGRLAEAEAAQREALAIRRKLYGDVHPDVAGSRHELAQVLLQQGKAAESLETLRESAYADLGLVKANRDRVSLEKAVQTLTQAVQKLPSGSPTGLQPLLTRSILLGRQGRWGEAISDLSQVLRASPNFPAFMLGPLLVETRDTAGYLNQRRLLWVRLGGSEDPPTAAETAMVILLQPAETGLSTASELADTAVTRGTNHARLPYFQLVKALAEYRQKQFGNASNWARQSLAGSAANHTTSVSAGAVLAMAQHQLKESAARQTLTQAVELSETKLPKVESGDLGENWPEWLIARILLREATALVDGNPTTAKPQN